MPVYKRNNAVFVKNGMPVVAPVGCTCCGRPYCCKIGVNECGNPVYECQTRPAKGDCLSGPYDTPEECAAACVTVPCPPPCGSCVEGGIHYLADGFPSHVACDPLVLPDSVQTIVIPAGCNYVTIKGGGDTGIPGGVDDDLMIDGVIIQQNMFTGGAACNLAHAVDYSFAKTGSFTIACVDNWLGNSGFDLQVCFSNLSSASPEDLIPSNPLP